MSIEKSQRIFKNKVIRYEKLLKTALNSLDGEFQVNVSFFNVNIRIRANRNIDNVIDLINTNNNIDLFKTTETDKVVLYQGYIKKDKYL